MHPVFIYALNCPTTGQTRYIGKAFNPKKRLSEHLFDAKTETYRCANWIRSLLKKGLRPVLEILAQVPELDWPQNEIDYIAAFRSMGCDLVNTTPGGVAPPILRGTRNPFFGKKHTPETKAKIRAARLGTKMSRESSDKKRDAMLGEKNHYFGKTHPPEVCAKISAAAIGRVPWNTGMRGTKRTAASCAKQRETIQKKKYAR